MKMIWKNRRIPVTKRTRTRENSVKAPAEAAGAAVFFKFWINSFCLLNTSNQLKSSAIYQFTCLFFQFKQGGEPVPAGNLRKRPAF